MSPADQKLWATLTHIGGIVFHWLVPLILLVLKDRGPFVRWHTRQALHGEFYRYPDAIEFVK